VLYVLGTPAPKGSGRAISIGGKARHVASGSDVNARALKSWDVAVREAARERVGFRLLPVFVQRPLLVRITFRMRRPAGHYGKNGLKPQYINAWPFVKPDADKLARATIDSLIGTLFDDDARICRLVAEKVYATPGTEGATIEIEALA